MANDRFEYRITTTSKRGTPHHFVMPQSSTEEDARRYIRLVLEEPTAIAEAVAHRRRIGRWRKLVADSSDQSDVQEGYEDDPA